MSKYILHDDVRTHGSGNAGLTNFHRTFGGPLTLVVILCDVLKAVAAILIALWLAGRFDPLIMPDFPLEQALADYYAVLFKYWAGLFCLLGHMFPCMFGISRGAKGILSGGTIAIMIDWRSRPGGLGRLSGAGRCSPGMCPSAPASPGAVLPGVPAWSCTCGRRLITVHRPR